MNLVKKPQGKLVLFDIDGTLLDRHNRIPASAKRAIFTLKEAGHTVALASGRSPFMLEHLRRELGLHSYVSFNGQYVVHEHRLIYSNPIGPELVAQLAAFASEQEHPLVYLDAEGMRCNQQHHPYVEQCMRSLDVLHPECDPRYYEGRHIYQTMLFCTEEHEAMFRQAFPDLHFVRWHPCSMDVLPAGGSKAAGIERLIAETGFRPEDIYAFGDNYNDMEMFRFVGCSIAMGNAPKAVKKLAAFVTSEAEQDGIWHGLRWAGLL